MSCGLREWRPIYNINCTIRIILLVAQHQYYESMCDPCTESHLNIAYPPNYVYLYTVLLYGSFLIFYI